MGFSRQEYWSGLPCPPPGDLPYPAIKPMSLMSPALSGGFFITSTTWEALTHSCPGKYLQLEVKSFEKGLCMCVRTQLLSHVRLFVTPWTAAHQVPQSMGLPRQEHWSGLLYPSPGDLPHPGTEPASLASPASAEGFFTTEPSGKPKKGWGDICHLDCGCLVWAFLKRIHFPFYQWTLGL